MPKRRDLRPDEREIWAKVASSVNPLPGRKPPKLDPKPAPKTAPKTSNAPALKSKPQARKTQTVARNVTVQGTTIPADRGNEKKVRRGQVDIDGRLDLHGLSQMEAETALRGFIQRGVARGARCLLVITGKGAPDDQVRRYVPWWEEAPGVIKRRTPEWLASPDIARSISGYARAHQRHGGDGAMYVFLKAIAK